MNRSSSDSTSRLDQHRDLIAVARQQVQALRNASPTGPGEVEPARKVCVQALQGLAPSFAGPAPDSFAGYQIEREIHRGGQGVVYQASQKSTKRKVAIKVMREGPFASRADRARFEREVEILGQLNHPNVVAVHDSGELVGDDPTLELRDLTTHEIIAQLECPLPIVVRSLAFTPDGERLLFPNPKGHIVHCWDLRAVREGVTAIGLDWNLPTPPSIPAESARPLLHAEVDLGRLAP